MVTNFSLPALPQANTTDNKKEQQIEMQAPTPTSSGLNTYRLADFATLPAALDYAAQGATGLNFYSGKGELLEALSYRELRTQSLALAQQFLALGLKPGDRVALIADTDGDFARAFFAPLPAVQVKSPFLPALPFSL